GAPSRRRNGRGGPAQGGRGLPLAADLAAAIPRRSRALCAGFGADREAAVRDRRAAVGHHAATRAAVGRSPWAGAALLGGHVPLAAAGSRRAGRSTSRARGCRLARDLAALAQVAA